MNKSKRIIGLFMVLAMICSVALCSFPIFAEPQTYDVSVAQDGSLTAVYEPTTNTLTISGSGATKDYSSYNTDLRSILNQVKIVNIEEGVTRIGNNFFSGDTYSTGLKIVSELSLPSTLTEIGERAFYYIGYSSELSINIPANVEVIEESAFNSGKGITSITFEGGSKITTIPKHCFYGCEKLTAIDLPDSVKVIDKQAYYNCKALTSVTLPSGLEQINQLAFSECTNVTTFICPSENVVIEGVIFGDYLSQPTKVMGYKATNKVATLNAKQGYMIEGLTLMGYDVTVEGTATEEDYYNSYATDCVF